MHPNASMTNENNGSAGANTPAQNQAPEPQAVVGQSSAIPAEHHRTFVNSAPKSTVAVSTEDPNDNHDHDPEKGYATAPVEDATAADKDNTSPRGTFVHRLRRRMTQRRTGLEEWSMPPEKHNNPDDYPPGYPRLAAHIDSETNTHLYRRFGYLRTRSLLYLQDELVCLERQLREMDIADAQEEPYRLAERAFDVEDDPKRQILFERINAKLKEYDDMVLRQREMLALRRVGSQDWRYYARYLWGKKPLAREDMEFVWSRSDMVDLYTHAESSWIKPMVDTVMRLIPQRVVMFIFRRKRRLPDGSEDIDPATHSLVDGRLEIVFKTIVVLLNVVLLLVPVALLYLLDANAWWKLAIIFIFIAMFTVVTLFMTQAKRNEVFVSVATYSAVLVVFLGNLPSPTA